MKCKGYFGSFEKYLTQLGGVREDFGQGYGKTQLIACCEANLELRQQVKANYISEKSNYRPIKVQPTYGKNLYYVLGQTQPIFGRQLLAMNTIRW